MDVEFFKFIEMKTIKTIIFCLVLMCMHNVVYAQDYSPYYPEIPNFSLFNGTWKYESDNEEFILKLKDFQYEFINHTFYHIVGVFKYVKNGKEIYNYLDFFEKIEEMPLRGVVKMFRMVDLPSTEQHKKVRIMFRDPKTINGTKSWLSTMEIIPGDTMKAKWHIEPDMWERDLTYEDDKGNVYTITDPTLLDGFTIPTDMIFTKIE